MTIHDHTIAVVVDRQFGDRITSLASRVPAWIGTSPTNRPVIEMLWANHPEYNLTCINAGEEDSGEELLLSMLDTIDEHHPSWIAMEVYGTPLTSEIASAFAEFGATSFEELPEGFIARRPGGESQEIDLSD